MQTSFRLDPTLPLMPGESPTSYVSRLAKINGISTARDFCLDMGFRFQDVVDGADEALTLLGELSGAAIDGLTRNSIRRTEETFSVANQRITKSALRRQRLFVCPACLRDDIKTSSLASEFAVYGRTAWLLNQIRTCPHHHLSLVEIDVVPGAQVHEFSFLVERSLLDLDRLFERAQQRPASGLETYLLNRLADDASQSQWLDDLDWFAAAKTCEMMGAVAEFGRTPNLKELTDDDWYRAGAKGFKIASGGRMAIRRFLSDLQQTYPYTRAGTDGPQAQFGRLYQWLAFGADDAAFNPVRNLIAQHIVETMPIGTGEVILGRFVETRIKHSIRTASLEIKAHPKRLRKILAATGIIGADHAERCDARVIFDAAAAEDVLSKAADALTLRDAESYLGAGRVQAQLLMDQGFIVPFVSSHAEGVWWHAFAKRDLDHFLTRLFDGAISIDGYDMPRCPIKVAAKYANCSAGEIVRFILDKRLKWVGRQAGIRGYDAVLVNLDEIRSLVKLAEPDGITAYEACKRLSTSHRVVKALIECGILQIVAAINPINRCPMNIIPNAVFSAFADQYVSLFELTQQFNLHHAPLRKALIDSDVRPAFDPVKIHAQFFKRAEIPETRLKSLGSASRPTRPLKQIAQE